MREVLALLALTAMLTGCSGGGGTAETTTAPSPTSSPATTQAAAGGVLDAKFDVGEHQLHIRCEGTGSPTVVYLHGHSQQPGDASGDGTGLIPSSVSENHHRFCGYDRANTGNSGKVPGPLNGKTTVADMHRLLQAAQLERYFPKDERFNHTEWKVLEEQVDQLTAYQQAHALLGKEPAIPVTYLLATPSGWTGRPAYEAVVQDYIAKYVDRFFPGVLKKVESPHYMEAAVTDRIAQELEKIIANP